VSRVVYLHLGAPKTGTTYLQNRLTLNADSLRKHDVHLPSGSRLVEPELFHFRAALDLLGQDWGGRPGHAAGAWPSLMRHVRRLDGTVIISHEILAPARPDVTARAMADLEGSEVHLVYSARDLARQLPAAWQESIKQGRRWRYSTFLRKVRRGKSWMHRALDLPAVLSTWGAHVPPERIHLVTVPPRTAADGTLVPRDTLWLRFCEAMGLDPAWAPIDSHKANQSLGAAEVEVIRRLNLRLPRPVRKEAATDKLVRDYLAQQALASRNSPPVQLPRRAYGWVDARAEEWIEWATEAGVDVVGDLADLRPQRPPEGTRVTHPDRLKAKQLLDPFAAALEAMTAEAARRPDPDHQLSEVVREGARRLRRK